MAGRRASNANDNYRAAADEEKLEELRAQIDKLSNAFEKQQQRSQPPPQNRRDSFITFNDRFVSSATTREEFLESHLTQPMKDFLNEFNKTCKQSNDPSIEANASALRLVDALNARRPTNKKGESIKPDADLKTKLALRALLLSIFLVSVAKII